MTLDMDNNHILPNVNSELIVCYYIIIKYLFWFNTFQMIKIRVDTIKLEQEMKKATLDLEIETKMRKSYLKGDELKFKSVLN